MPAELGMQNPTSGVFLVDRVHTKVDGDTLALIAFQEYGNPALWRQLAIYNGIDDAMRVDDGMSIMLPPADALTAVVVA
jgi:nucleoid-associated protein YgaU